LYSYYASEELEPVKKKNGSTVSMRGERKSDPVNSVIKYFMQSQSHV
jgi:hypothetical protein